MWKIYSVGNGTSWIPTKFLLVNRLTAEAKELRNDQNAPRDKESENFLLFPWSFASPLFGKKKR